MKKSRYNQLILALGFIFLVILMLAKVVKADEKNNKLDEEISSLFIEKEIQTEDTKALDEIIKELNKAELKSKLDKKQRKLSKDKPNLIYGSEAKIIILNKIVAKSEEVIFKIGESKYFGNLSVKVHNCVKNTNPYEASNIILLSVIDNKIDTDSEEIFRGWIISSNASLSALEHPAYEIFAKECITNQ